MMVDGFFGNIPHANTLGIEFVSIERSKSCLKIPYKKELAGNPSTGTIHGGVIISIMDSVGGMAVFAALPAIEAIATLDLRVDYMKPAAIGKAVYASAECYKLTNTIAFVRGVAYQDDENDPVATCTAAFMRASSHAVATTEGFK
ncbi:MAG: thioesterase [Gammaproteobacteria bacterium]|nr:MAG: thioesterase [Gammaproteobacteria bacterium]